MKKTDPKKEDAGGIEAKDAKGTVANGRFSDVLVAPLITEASSAAMELNKYVFRVATSAGKGEIKKAVEALYKVKVISVNTSNAKRKLRSYGKTPGWKTGFKKATITLKAGDKIEMFKGV